MRNYLILATIAPLALLAACGDSDTETNDANADMAADTTANDTAMTADAGAEAAVEATPTALADAGDYSGVYSYADAGGTERAVRLNSAAKTYDYYDANNELRSGSYTWTPDGYRIWIQDYYGEPSWFAVSNDELVRLQQDVEISDPTMVVTGDRYTRADEGDAVFSRFPELGSPVAPQD